MSKDFTMEIQDGFDHIIEEGQNTSLNLRKINWNGRGFKLDLRKWNYQDGQERANKGVTLTEDGASELANVLVSEGYGDTKKIIKAIQKRDDYNDSMNHINDVEVEEDDGSEEYYDPSELLSSSLVS